MSVPVLVTWTATHTGLPSFRVVSDVPVRVVCGERVVARLDAGDHLFSDALAAPGPNSYTIGGLERMVLRRDDGFLLTDAAGRRRVVIDLLGDDAVSRESGLVTFGNTDVARWPLSRPRATGSLAARTSGEDTVQLRALVQARGPLVSVHSPSLCQIPECDIPPVRRILVRESSESRTGTVDRARRTWSIAWREDPSASPAPAPVVTWGEWAGLGEGWQDVSAVAVAQLVAGMPS